MTTPIDHQALALKELLRSIELEPVAGDAMRKMAGS
jgi:hypothetical protein